MNGKAGNAVGGADAIILNSVRIDSTLLARRSDSVIRSNAAKRRVCDRAEVLLGCTTLGLILVVFDRRWRQQQLTAHNLTRDGRDAINRLAGCRNFTVVKTRRKIYSSIPAEQLSRLQLANELLNRWDRP